MCVAEWFARVAAIETAIEVLGRGLELAPPPLDKSVVKAARKLLNKKELAALGVMPGERR